MFSKHFFYGNERIRFSFSEVFWKRIYLVIAFPSNRHSSKWDRIIFYHQIVLHKLIRIIPNFEFILICLWREMDNSYYWVDAIYFADVDSPWIDQRDYVRAKKKQKTKSSRSPKRRRYPVAAASALAGTSRIFANHHHGLGFQVWPPWHLSLTLKVNQIKFRWVAILICRHSTASSFIDRGPTPKLYLSWFPVPEKVPFHTWTMTISESPPGVASQSTARIKLIRIEPSDWSSISTAPSAPTGTRSIIDCVGGKKTIEVSRTESYLSSERNILMGSCRRIEIWLW